MCPLASQNGYAWIALVVGNANVGPCNGGNKRYPDFTMCSTVLPAVRETLP
jgi:hypothetical protein